MFRLRKIYLDVTVNLIAFSPDNRYHVTIVSYCFTHSFSCAQYIT